MLTKVLIDDIRRAGILRLLGPAAAARVGQGSPTAMTQTLRPWVGLPRVRTSKAVSLM